MRLTKTSTQSDAAYLPHYMPRSDSDSDLGELSHVRVSRSCDPICCKTIVGSFGFGVSNHCGYTQIGQPDLYDNIAAFKFASPADCAAPKSGDCIDSSCTNGYINSASQSWVASTFCAAIPAPAAVSSSAPSSVLPPPSSKSLSPSLLIPSSSGAASSLPPSSTIKSVPSSPSPSSATTASTFALSSKAITSPSSTSQGKTVEQTSSAATSLFSPTLQVSSPVLSSQTQSSSQFQYISTSTKGVFSAPYSSATPSPSNPIQSSNTPNQSVSMGASSAPISSSENESPSSSIQASLASSQADARLTSDSARSSYDQRNTSMGPSSAAPSSTTANYLSSPSAIQVKSITSQAEESIAPSALPYNSGGGLNKSILLIGGVAGGLGLLLAVALVGCLVLVGVLIQKNKARRTIPLRPITNVMPMRYTPYQQSAIENAQADDSFDDEEDPHESTASLHSVQHIALLAAAKINNPRMPIDDEFDTDYEDAQPTNQSRYLPPQVPLKPDLELIKLKLAAALPKTEIEMTDLEVDAAPIKTHLATLAILAKNAPQMVLPAKPLAKPKPTLPPPPPLQTTIADDGVAITDL